MTLERDRYQSQEDLPCPVNSPKEFEAYLEMRQQEAQLGLIATNTVVALETSDLVRQEADFAMPQAMAG